MAFQVALVVLTLDSFTVHLHSPNGRQLPAIRAVRGTVCSLWKTMEIPNGHMSQQSKCDWGNPNLYLWKPIRKGWFQIIGGHVSWIINSPDATRLGLCSSPSVIPQWLTWGTWAPSHSIFFLHSSNLYCFHWRSDKAITTKFCACHDSYAAVVCAKFFSDQMIRYWKTI